MDVEEGRLIESDLPVLSCVLSILLTWNLAHRKYIQSILRRVKPLTLFLLCTLCCGTILRCCVVVGPFPNPNGEGEKRWLNLRRQGANSFHLGPGLLTAISFSAFGEEYWHSELEVESRNISLSANRPILPSRSQSSLLFVFTLYYNCLSFLEISRSYEGRYSPMLVKLIEALKKSMQLSSLKTLLVIYPRGSLSALQYQKELLTENPETALNCV